jgi:ABC-type amino acid transport substrate-binding protein
LLQKNTQGQQLADLFDRGLEKIFANGTLERLIKEYKVANSILSDFE